MERREVADKQEADMKAIVYTLLLISIVFFLVGCSGGMTTPIHTAQINDVTLAEDALVTFLGSLHDGQYEEAAQLYGGSYEIMLEQNPGIDPTDHALLMENACTINGAVCLEVKGAELERVVSPTEFEFIVEFLNEDGTLFVLGPCCGGNTTDSPPQSGFIFTMIKDSNGKFLVMDMPPYMP